MFNRLDPHLHYPAKNYIIGLINVHYFATIYLSLFNLNYIYILSIKNYTNAHALLVAIQIVARGKCHVTSSAWRQQMKR